MISPLHAARPVVAGTALTCLAVLASACSNSTPKPAATVTVTAAPASSAATAAPASTVPAQAPSAPAGPAPCATRDLSLKLGLSQGAAGSVYQVLDFTNISNVSCTLYGYPGVSLAAGHPITQIGMAAAENPSPPRELVTLAPGAVANALLRVVNAANYPPAKCGMVTAKWLQVYPPNQTTPIYLAYTTQTCSKQIRTLTVNVVQPGSGG
jgi:Domain of unknown function (DUF4232)